MSSASYRLGAVELAGAIRRKEISAVAVLESVLERIALCQPKLNAFRVILSERARAEAAAVDVAIAAGKDPGPLAGVPYGAKDLFDVAGLPTAAGSKINLDRLAATADSVLVARMRAAGAVLLGVQTMDEYAYGFTTENAHYGPVHNPHDLSRSAGGSSGGSAAAVAAGLGALSIGSDTNGSIRVPSSFCGIFGLKPTFGRLPRSGSFPFVYDIDHVGPFARSVADLAHIYDVLQGWDSSDPACVRRAPDLTFPALATDTPLRIAVLGGWFEDMATAEAKSAVAAAADALSARDRVTFKAAELARSAAFLISVASGANLHRENLRARPGDFDPGTRGRFLAGALLPADVVLQAQRVRRRAYDEAMSLFEHHDVLLAPSTPTSAPLIGASMQVRANIGVLTQPISAIGLPVVAAPVRTGGLPIGVQIIAAPWREDLALQCAARLEAAGVATSQVVDP
ncbi:MAG: AtzE family amidohydrolase [Alphaproteobacteria bacterium]